MLKMSDTLARLTRPHGALSNFEEEDAPLVGDRKQCYCFLLCMTGNS